MGKRTGEEKLGTREDQIEMRFEIDQGKESILEIEEGGGIEIEETIIVEKTKNETITAKREEVMGLVIIIREGIFMAISVREGKRIKKLKRESSRREKGICRAYKEFIRYLSTKFYKVISWCNSKALTISRKSP